MLRRRRRSAPPPADLHGLEPRWRTAVQETIAARDRLATLLAGCPDGPLRDRLASIRERVENGVQAATAIAVQAQAASRTVASFDLEAVTEGLKDARRRMAQAAQSDADTTALATEVQVLADQHSSLSQLANEVEAAAERLRLLDLRLDAAVARAAQIVLRPDALAAFAPVEQELVSVLDELDALRAGFASVDSPGS